MPRKSIVCHPSRTHLPVLLSLLLAPYTLANAAQPTDTNQAHVRPDGALQWVGATGQVGVGYDSLQKLRAELSGVLSESSHSAVLGSAWLAKRAGGVKLAYQYQPAEQTNASVRKIFGALDQNSQGDRKLTLGGGLEGEHWFGTGYASRALTGQREISFSSLTSVGTVTGIENDRPYIDTTTTNTVTRTYERAYDYGLGVEVGRTFDAPGITLSLRLDHEWGKESARQDSLTFGIQKRFIGTPHSLALQASAYNRSGPLENDRRDTRAMLMYRYDFGGSPNYRAERNVRMTPVTSEKINTQAAARNDENLEAVNKPADKPRTETRLVKTTVTMTGDAFFGLNSAALTAGAKKQLADLVEALRKNGIEGAIRVVGHTCNLGSDKYNLKLSERRAEAVRDFLTEATGMSKDAIQTKGMGKADPKYSNKAGSREKNRRVDIEFISVQSKEDVITLPPAEPTSITPSKTSAGEPAKAASSIEWKSEVIEEEPTWVRRALRALPGHKQYVDTYRYARTEQSSTTRRDWVNRAPSANDDAVSVMAGTSVVVPVIANDSDPDGDAIQIDSVGAPKFGTATIEGGTIRYSVPVNQAPGNDEFSYTIRDAKGAKSTARIRVAINAYNQAPIAVNDSATVAAGASVLIPVLANDSDPDGDSIQLDSVSAPAVGTASVENGAIRYTAPVGAPAGDVSFGYTVRDAKGAKTSASVRVTISVIPNNPPSARNDLYYIYREQVNTQVVLDVLKNDSDPDGDALKIVSFTQPSNNIGSVSLSGNKLILVTTKTFAVSTFTYTITDDKGGTATAIVELMDP